MADITEELATIRTGIYGKDIRAALGDAIEKVNISGGGTGSAVVEIRDVDGYASLSEVEKEADVLYFIEYRNIIVWKRDVYGGPVRCATRSDYESVRTTLFTTGGAYDKVGLTWLIEDEKVIICNNVEYATVHGEVIQVETAAEYDDIKDNLPDNAAVFIKNSRLIIVDGVYYADTSGFKVIVKTTKSDYDDMKETGSINPDWVYAIKEE